MIDSALTNSQFAMLTYNLYYSCFHVVSQYELYFDDLLPFHENTAIPAEFETYLERHNFFLTCFCMVKWHRGQSRTLNGLAQLPCAILWRGWIQHLSQILTHPSSLVGPDQCLEAYLGWMVTWQPMKLHPLSGRGVGKDGSDINTARDQV